jgi:2-dehydro-3-deoxyphosphooctonate aldolase (KDO 8-P synthase)
VTACFKEEIKIKAVKQVVLNDKIVFGDNNRPFVLIAGPCVLEGPERSLLIGRKIKEITDRLGIPYIYKASFDKANRSSIKSYRGPGLEEGLDLLKGIKEELGVPVLTDFHEPEQAGPVAEIVDILQIPAFLCRQTDLLLAAAETGKIINVKKGQFLAPWDMEKVINKLVSAGNERLLLTERGVSFGYNNLVVDMSSLPIMRGLGYPVVFDATHSVQRPGARGETSGGDREFVPYLSRAAAAVGIDALFMEVHDNPEEALSDGPNMLYLNELEELLQEVLAIDALVKKRGA